MAVLDPVTGPETDLLLLRVAEFGRCGTEGFQPVGDDRLLLIRGASVPFL